MEEQMKIDVEDTVGVGASEADAYEEKLEMHRRRIHEELLGKKSAFETTEAVDFRRIGRKDLLEMLLEMKEREIKLVDALAEARLQAEDRRIVAEEAGSIAEAALRLNHVFEAAQKAADEYLESVRTVR